MIDAPFEMANLFPKHTGLPFVVWISYRGGARHDVRVKVSRGPKATSEEMISVALRPTPHLVEGDLDSREFQPLAKWLELNRETLLKSWEGDIDTKDALDAIVTLK